MSISSANLNNQAIQASQNVQDLSAAGGTDAESLLKMQQALADYQIKFGMASAYISDMKSTSMSIIQKM